MGVQIHRVLRILRGPPPTPLPTRALSLRARASFVVCLGADICVAEGVPDRRSRLQTSCFSSVVSGSSTPLSWAWSLSSIPTPGTPDPGEGATSYIIEAGSGTGLSDLASFDTGSTATTFRADGVAAGTYFIRVRAVNGCGVSAASVAAILIVS